LLHLSGGERLRHHALLNRGHGVRTHVYRAPKAACANCIHRSACAPQKSRLAWGRSITRIEEPATTTAFKTKMKTEEAGQGRTLRIELSGEVGRTSGSRNAFSTYRSGYNGCHSIAPVNTDSFTRSCPRFLHCGVRGRSRSQLHMAHERAGALQQAGRIRQRCALKEAHVYVRSGYIDAAEGGISQTCNRTAVMQKFPNFVPAFSHPPQTTDARGLPIHQHVLSSTHRWLDPARPCR